VGDGNPRYVQLSTLSQCSVGQLKSNWSSSEATRTHVLVLTDGDPISLLALTYIKFAMDELETYTSTPNSYHSSHSP